MIGNGEDALKEGGDGGGGLDQCDIFRSFFGGSSFGSKFAFMFPRVFRFLSANFILFSVLKLYLAYLKVTTTMTSPSFQGYGLKVSIKT